MVTNKTDQIVIISGMPRTGTSYLYYVLQNHPNLFLPHRKELSFFCSNYDKGYKWYLNFFKNIRPQELGLDISPVYFMHSGSICRIKKFNSEIKVILCIRKPSDWILSWYSQLLSHEFQLPPFDEFITNHWFKPTIGQKFHIKLDDDFISNNINQYGKIFGDKILIYHYDLFKSNPLKILQSIEKFLGLPEYFAADNVENVIINAGNRKNIWLVSFLLSREPIVHFLEFCVPKKKLQQIRNIFDKSAIPGNEKNAEIYTKQNIQLAKKYFSNDDAFVESFFSSHAIQLGDGTGLDLK